MVHAELRQHFYRRLSPHYLQGELQALYHWCVQEIEGWSRAVAYAHNESDVNAERLEQWNTVIDRLVSKEPVQYIFSKASFYGLELHVDERVLIPRPETEELVAIVLKELKESQLHVLDIGTGSGCIALALKSNRPSWKVSAWDVSEEALKVAQENENRLRLDIHWMQVDVRDEKLSTLGIDVIVSNPPYIPSDLRGTLDREVEYYEPNQALFAPDEDPFYFFRRIAEIAEESGVKVLFFETHATDLNALIRALERTWKGKVRSMKDNAGKPRFLHLCK